MPTPGTSTRKQPQPVAKKVIPMLKVQGLGFSNLIRENGKTQEELDVDSQVKSSQMQMSIANQSEFFKKMDAPASVAGESQLN
jgi:arsenate reductase-like glutaredoxin family protein